MREIKVSLIEDDSALREQVARVINATPGLRVVSEHPNGAHALKNLPAAQPRVALVDIRMPRLGGIECVRLLKAMLPDLLPVMLTQYGEDDLIYEALQAGAVGYLLKGHPASDLTQAIREVVAGGSPMTPEIARRVALFFHGRSSGHPKAHLLTAREDEILGWLQKGYSNKEIAGHLEISPNTVANHLQNIYRKLHAGTRTEAANRRFRR